MQSETLFWTSYGALWLVVLLQVALTLAMARVVGRLSKRLPPAGARMTDPGPDIDEKIEGWAGTDLLERPFDFRFPRERGLLLVYVSPHCSVCAELVPAARRFFSEIASSAEGAWVIAAGTPDVQLRYARQKSLEGSVVLVEDALPSRLRVGGSPYAVWLDASGAVRAKGMVNTREHLESLATAVASGFASLDDLMNEREGATSTPEAAAWDVRNA